MDSGLEEERHDGEDAQASESSNGSGDDGKAGGINEHDAAPKRRKARDPNAPIPPWKIPKAVAGPMRAFVKSIDRMNDRVEGGKYKISAYCAVVFDHAEKKGRSTSGMILHQGKVLTAGSVHMDLGLRSSDTDSQLHRLFQCRLNYHHMARDVNTLNFLEAQLNPANHAAPNATEPNALEPNATAPQAVEPQAGELSMLTVMPVKRVPAGSFEANRKLAQEMMLTLYNMDWGNDEVIYGETYNQC